MAESCERLKRDLSKAERKTSNWARDMVNRIDTTLQATEKLLELADEAGEDFARDVPMLADGLCTLSEKLVSSHKEYHVDISRVGKSIDKNFMADFACTCEPTAMQGDHKKLLNECIADHLQRQSRSDVNHTFCQEAELEESEVTGPYIQLRLVLEALRQRNVQPALDWIETRRKKLGAGSKGLELDVSQLLFKLMRLHFISLLPGNLEEVLAYAKSFLQGHDEMPHKAEARRLIGCLVYRNNLADSPYSDLLSDSLWEDARDNFRRTFCRILALPIDSPLATCIYAGCIALPQVIDLHLTVDKSQVNKMETELLTDIDLGDRCLYHSAFACPVMRRELTEMPKRLVCGHVISAEAENALRSGSKVKCPYCPTEMYVSDVIRVYF